jgi:hypothetical protein
MDRALDLSAVGRHTVAGFEICGTEHLGHVTVFVRLDLINANDIAAHKTNLVSELHTEILGTRIERYVFPFNEELTGERKLAGTRIFIVGVVGKIEIFHLILGIVGYNYLYGIEHRNTAEGLFVKIFTNAVLQKSDINERIILCNTYAVDEIEYCFGGIAASAKSAESGHSGVVPAVYELVFNERTKEALAHYGVGDVKTCKFDLSGSGGYVAMLDYPVIKGTVVLIFE